MLEIDPDLEVALTWNGSLNDNSDTDSSWSMEIAIPVSQFSELDDFHSVQAGSRWAFLAVRQDRNKMGSVQRSRSTLFPIGDLNKGGVHQPGRFGRLEFTE